MAVLAYEYHLIRLRARRKVAADLAVWSGKKRGQVTDVSECWRVATRKKRGDASQPSTPMGRNGISMTGSLRLSRI
jgi:hypothetical protein